MPWAEIARIAVCRDDDRIRSYRMPACVNAEPGAGAGDPAGADIAEQPDAGGGGDAKDTMMKLRRMHGTTAVKQHAAAIERRINMVSASRRRHHAGTRRGDIIQPRE